MTLSPGLRTMTGMMTIVIYGLIGLVSWPGVKWLTIICAILATVRLVLLVRQWPRRDG